MIINILYNQVNDEYDGPVATGDETKNLKVKKVYNYLKP